MVRSLLQTQIMNHEHGGNAMNMEEMYLHFQSSDKLIENSFSLTMLDNMKEKEFLFLLVWNNHHFFLLIGRVNGRRWEYYNSLKSNGDYIFTENYVS